MTDQQGQPPLFEIRQKLDHGVKNPIVARMTLQMLEVMQHTTLNPQQREKIGGIFMDSLVNKLLRCWEIEQRVRLDWENAVADFKPPARGSAAVQVPQVSRLREDCEDFLYSAKNFLRDLVFVFSDLYGTEYKDASDWGPVGKRTDSVMTYARATFGQNHVNAKFFDQLPACIVPFVELRNAVEHPGGFSGTLTTENIFLTSGSGLGAPRWRREKDGKISYGPLLIIEDMRIGVNNLLVLAEGVVVMWAADHLAVPNAMQIAAIPEGKRDPNCAIKYKVYPSSVLLQKLAAVQVAR